MQHALLERERLGDRLGPAAHMPSIVGGHPAHQQPVQLGKRGDDRDGDQPVAAEPADLALHPTLLVRALDARLAEKRVEPIM
jgi:hypothetical protein